ncbi:hypothetical protein S245_046396 [Arachis hypogaea]
MGSSSTAGGATDGTDDEGQDRPQNSRRFYHRHTPHQIAKLEEAFNACAHPSDSMRRQLGTELGLEPRQVKFWFQNRRTQAKAQADRSNNCALRRENERMMAENLMFRESLKSVVCITCGGPTIRDDDCHIRLEQFKLENDFLVQEYRKMGELLASYNIIGADQVVSPLQLSSVLSSLAISGSITTPTPTRTPTPTPTPAAAIPCLIDPQIEASLCQRFHSLCRQNTTLIPPQGSQSSNSIIRPFNGDRDHQDMMPAQSAAATPTAVAASETQIGTPAAAVVSFFTEEEIVRMKEAAIKAVDEVARLLRMNEPFWFRSTVDGNFILQRQSYDGVFHNVGLKCEARREASKDSRVVAMSGRKLVDMFLDSEKWVSLFPTMVKKADTIEVLNTGLPQTRSGALQLMYADIHILSPLLRSREFFFLRYCVQVDVGAWIIADVSFDSSRFLHSLTWKLPSGCLIHDMNDGYSTITWVEHVEISDSIQTNPIFRDLVCSNSAFGAERWILTLERMCERIAFASMNMMPSCDSGVIASPEGRKNVMEFSERMVKLFCGSLDMTGNMELQYGKNNNGVRVGIRRSIEAGVPKGLIVTASTSLWLPLLPQTLFNFFKDPSTRHQWDVLCHGNPVTQIQRISNGTFSDNFTTILRPYIPTENNTLLLQECCTDFLGSVVVYAPVDVGTITAAINGEDTTTMPILPSGFTICGDGSPPRGAFFGCALPESRHYGGSILTVTVQVLVSNQNAVGQFNMNTVDAVNGLAATTVKKIKAAFKCP